jgi:hypothetical protein
MTRNPLSASLPQAHVQVHNGTAPHSLPPPGFDNRLASRWQSPSASVARGGPAQIDAQQTLFAALKTAAQRRAG